MGHELIIKLENANPNLELDPQQSESVCVIVHEPIWHGHSLQQSELVFVMVHEPTRQGYLMFFWIGKANPKRGWRLSKKRKRKKNFTPARARWPKRLGLIRVTPWADFAVIADQPWSTTITIYQYVALSWNFAPSSGYSWITVNPKRGQRFEFESRLRIWSFRPQTSMFYGIVQSQFASIPSTQEGTGTPSWILCGKLQQFGTKGYHAERNRCDSESILWAFVFGSRTLSPEPTVPMHPHPHQSLYSYFSISLQFFSQVAPQF